MNIPIILISLFTLNLIDLWSTMICISNGFKESNPFMRFLLDAGFFMEYKLLFGFGLLIISYYYSKRDTSDHSFLRYSLLTVCMIYASTIWNNFSLIL